MPPIRWGEIYNRIYRKLIDERDPKTPSRGGPAAVYVRIGSKQSESLATNSFRSLVSDAFYIQRCFYGTVIALDGIVLQGDNLHNSAVWFVSEKHTRIDDKRRAAAAVHFLK